jgi:ABC-type multidrug transport system fused ATPase/permease subunit
MVGDRGNKLSGGERQRVALARVLIRDPKIVVFDEPTSQLDGAAVRDTGNILRESAATRVTFLVAHRIETVRIATRVLLMDHGRIVAEGTPEELEESNALFRSLFSEPGQKTQTAKTRAR